MLDELQNMILQGGALSKFFWPITKSAPHLQRGETLRQMYRVDDSNPLRSRQLRNALEHFDERLDLYLQKPIVGHVLTHYVGPFDEGDGVPVHLFRAFYTDTAVFEILGERHEVEPICEAIEHIHGKHSE